MTGPVPVFVDRPAAPPETRRATRTLWRPFATWCVTFGLSPDQPNAAILVLYLAQRAFGDWAPPRGKTAGLKYNSILGIKDSIIRAWEWAGHDVARIRSDRLLGHFLANLHTRNTVSQNVAQTARPLTEEDLRSLITLLATLVRDGWVSQLWAASWKARILIGAAGGFRISELLTMEKPWLHPVTNGRLQIVVPKGKYQNDPKTVEIAFRGDDLCPLTALLAWFDLASTIPEFVDMATVFPSVSKLAPLPSTPTPPVSVRGMHLSEFPHLVAELTDLIDPATIAAGSSRKLNWVCQNGHTWSAAIQARTANGSGCPVCRRGGARITDHKGQTRQILDAITDKITNPEFHPGEDQALRSCSAVNIVTNEAIEQIKMLCTDAGIGCGEYERLTSHIFRKTTGTQMANDGHALTEISRHLRHKNERATRPYLVEGHLTHPPITSEIPDW